MLGLALPWLDRQSWGQVHEPLSAVTGVPGLPFKAKISSQAVSTCHRGSQPEPRHLRPVHTVLSSQQVDENNTELLVRNRIILLLPVMLSIKNTLKALGRACQIHNRTMLALTFPTAQVSKWHISIQAKDQWALNLFFQALKSYQKVYYPSEDI